jgi:hypothetical protein
MAQNCWRVNLQRVACPDSVLISDSPVNLMVNMSAAPAGIVPRKLLRNEEVACPYLRF